MKEILLTSSALILALLVLRQLFRSSLSRRVQYALWGLVLLRLLVPISLPAASFSLMTAAEPVASSLEGQALYISPSQITLTAPEGETLPSYSYKDDPRITLGPSSPDNVYTFTNHNQVVHTVEYAWQINLKDLLRPVWYVGMTVMACWFLLSNLRFRRKLLNSRKPCAAEGCSCPVYLVEEGLPSPCLFGLFRPAIYLTPAALNTPERLRHVLAHEETHARHLDPLWSLLRALCLTVYWFDPLVWLAALVSRTDCELACDEGALRRLGETERIPYGQTLLSLIPVRRNPADPMLSATTMTAGKRQLKDRITRIAENRKPLGMAVFAVVALSALVCAVTFTGAKPDSRLTAEETVSALAEELGAEDGFFGERLIVFTPENQTDFIRLDQGELLRVYWGAPYLLSSDIRNPMGWLCSLYRLEGSREPEPVPGRVTQIIGADGTHTYTLAWPAQPPEVKNIRTQGGALMNAVLGRVQETHFHCLGSGTPAEGQSLTQEERMAFQQDFAPRSGDGSPNLRLQFLTSFYARPQDIDLFELFYNGAGDAPPKEDSQEFSDVDWGEDFAAKRSDGQELVKLSREGMDAVLKLYAGVSLKDAREDDLYNEHFFVTAYDAYYFLKQPGASNAPQGVYFIYGTREDGLVRLYYKAGDLFPLYEGLVCLTLEERPGGGYRIFSNQPADRLPMVYPPAKATISLDGLEPYEPQPAELVPVPYDHLEMLGGPASDDGNILGDYCVSFYTGGGRYFAGIQSVFRSSFPPAFLELSDSFSMTYFRNLFGHDGFCIEYERENLPVCDYYFLNEEGWPMLLARMGRDSRPLDLDGDGQSELVSAYNAQIVLERDGKLYDVDVESLVEEAWPEAESVAYGDWDAENRFLSLSGFVQMDTNGPEPVKAIAFRGLYYDGADLLLCADPRRPAEGMNHMMGRYDAPAEVIAAAQELAVSGLAQRQQEDGPAYDDWRVCTLTGPFSETISGQEYEIWQTDYELHTPTAELVALSGSAHLTEDSWVSSGRPSYLIFRTEEQAEPPYTRREYLFSIEDSDTAPGSRLFRGEMVDQLQILDLLSLDQMEGPDLLQQFRTQPELLLETAGTLLTEDRRDKALTTLAAELRTSGTGAWQVTRQRLETAQLTRGGPEAWARLKELVGSSAPLTAAEAAQAAMTELMAKDRISIRLQTGADDITRIGSPQLGDGPKHEKYFTADYDWSYAEAPADLPGECLTIWTRDLSFSFWKDSDLVLLRRGEEPAWFRAVCNLPQPDPFIIDIFGYMRLWYDDIELEVLRSGETAIPDQGQSRLEIAKAWVNAYTQPHLLCTPGSRWAYTYDRCIVELEEGLTPETVSGWPEGEERIYFSYHEIFVLENDSAYSLSGNLAGNAAAYEGEYGEAPDGAQIKWLIGYLRKTEEGWRLGQLGTSP